MKRAVWQRRKAMLHLAEATLARYEIVKGRGRAHAPDFNALMMRICARIVEEQGKVPTPACCDGGPHRGPHMTAEESARVRELQSRRKTGGTLRSGDAAIRKLDKALKGVHAALSEAPNKVDRPMHPGRFAGINGHCSDCGAKPGQDCRRSRTQHGDDGRTQADEDAARMEMNESSVDETPYGGEDGEP